MENKETFVILIRGDETNRLMRDPKAFVLLAQIALRANINESENEKGLLYGQAFIGDHEEVGLTEKEYRNAKTRLMGQGLATFNGIKSGVKRGTIATINNNNVLRISCTTKANKLGVEGANNNILVSAINKETEMFSQNEGANNNNLEGQSKGEQGASNNNIIINYLFIDENFNEVLNRKNVDLEKLDLKSIIPNSEKSIQYISKPLKIDKSQAIDFINSFLLNELKPISGYRSYGHILQEIISFAKKSKIVTAPKINDNFLATKVISKTNVIRPTRLQLQLIDKEILHSLTPELQQLLKSPFDNTVGKQRVQSFEFEIEDELVEKVVCCCLPGISVELARTELRSFRTYLNSKRYNTLRAALDRFVRDVYSKYTR